MEIYKLEPLDLDDNFLQGAVVRDGKHGGYGINFYEIDKDGVLDIDKVIRDYVVWYTTDVIKIIDVSEMNNIDLGIRRIVKTACEVAYDLDRFNGRHLCDDWMDKNKLKRITMSLQYFIIASSLINEDVENSKGEDKRDEYTLFKNQSMFMSEVLNYSLYVNRTVVIYDKNMSDLTVAYDHEVEMTEDSELNRLRLFIRNVLDEELDRKKMYYTIEHLEASVIERDDKKLYVINAKYPEENIHIAHGRTIEEVLIKTIRTENSIKDKIIFMHPNKEWYFNVWRRYYNYNVYAQYLTAKRKS